MGRPNLPEVGALDPELRNSPVAQELDEDVDIAVRPEIVPQD